MSETDSFPLTPAIRPNEGQLTGDRFESVWMTISMKVPFLQREVRQSVEIISIGSKGLVAEREWNCRPVTGMMTL